MSVSFVRLLQSLVILVALVIVIRHGLCQYIHLSRTMYKREKHFPSAATVLAKISQCLVILIVFVIVLRDELRQDIHLS